MTHPLPPTSTPEPGPPAAEIDLLSSLSKEDLWRILNTLPVIVWWKDQERRFGGVNQSYLDRVLGPPSRVLGLRDEEVFGDTPEVAAYRQYDLQVLATGEPLLNLEEDVRNADGNQVRLLTCKVPLRDASGTILGVLGVASDITEQKTIRDELTHLREAAEAALDRENRQNNLLRIVMEAIPHCVFWKDADLNYRGCNQNFATVCGHTSTTAVVGKTDFDLPWTHEEVGVLPPLRPRGHGPRGSDFGYRGKPATRGRQRDHAADQQGSPA